MLHGVCGLELRVTQEQRLLRQQRRRQRRRQQSRRNTHSPLTTTSMVCGFGAIRAVLVTGCRNLLVLLLHIAPRADTSFAMCSARGVVRVRTQRWMTTKRPTMRLPEMLAASVHAASLAVLPFATIVVQYPAYVLKWSARASDGFVRTGRPTVTAQTGRHVLEVRSCGTNDKCPSLEIHTVT